MTLDSLPNIGLSVAALVALIVLGRAIVRWVDHKADEMFEIPGGEDDE